MAARSWAGSTVTAIGVAAGAGAAQLGVGYGLGVVVWLPADHQHSEIALLSSLAWVVWIAADSVVLGAVTANWLASFGAAPERSGFLLVSWRATIAVGAAAGAVVVAPLAAVQAHAVQAREASRTAQIPPDELLVAGDEWTVAGYAVIGVVAGLLIAFAALGSRAIAANVIASAAYLWTLGLVAIVDALRDATDPVIAQLAFWKFNGGPMVRDFYVPGVLVMLGGAFLIGVLASWRAGRRGDSRVGVAISGAIGPLLVAAAYLLAAPKLTGAGEVDLSQWSAYLFAPYAVISGLAGSVLVAAIGPKGGRSWVARRPKPPAAQPEPDLYGETPAETPVVTEPDELDGWASELGDKKDDKKDDKKPAPAGAADRSSRSTGRASVTSEPDLADDAYAPARAYPSTDPAAAAYATDTVDEPAPAKATPAKATGTATPLWPSTPDSDSGDDEDKDPPTGRRGRRGRR